jgi:ElaB/YqjD/DUF883 family membrane-anchored ribosome-binding protein
MPDPTPTPLAAAQERLGPKLEEAQAQLEAFSEKAKTFIRQNPGAALLGAVAAGYLLGKLVSRK